MERVILLIEPKTDTVYIYAQDGTQFYRCNHGIDILEGIVNLLQGGKRPIADLWDGAREDCVNAEHTFDMLLCGLLNTPKIKIVHNGIPSEPVSQYRLLTAAGAYKQGVLAAWLRGRISTGVIYAVQF